MNYSQAKQKSERCKHIIIVTNSNKPKPYTEARLLCRIKIKDGWRSDACNHNCPLSE